MTAICAETEHHGSEYVKNIPWLGESIFLLAVVYYDRYSKELC